MKFSSVEFYNLFAHVKRTMANLLGFSKTCQSQRDSNSLYTGLVHGGKAQHITFAL